METVLSNIFGSFIFWAAWIVIPLIMEVIPAIGSFIVLLKIRIQNKQIEPPIIYPEISIIIPIYNSQATLEACIKSINDSNYPTDAIRVFLVDNQGSAECFAVFAKCQDKFPDLRMQWLNSEQGKSRALNMALYNSEGKYIIHIDSDGVLEKDALRYMVDKFESDSSVNCMTGSILVEPALIMKYKRGLPRLLRRLEFMEYAQAFLAGRTYAAEMDTMYTVSGAFSGFRKSAILKSWLFNTDTICEDTQITFQMRYLQHEKIDNSRDSIFMVDPIEDMNKLYTQRQRWQRGSLEVSKMFMNQKFKPHNIVNDVGVRTLMYDHTFAFPRLIWYLALICLMFVGYSSKTILGATAILFAIYIICGFLYFATVVGCLDKFPEIRKFYASNWWVVPLLPFFNFIVFFIRMAGIINSINTDSAWKTRNLTDEKNAFVEVIKGDTGKVSKAFKAFADFCNED